MHETAVNNIFIENGARVRLSTVDKVLMVGVALFFDTIQLLLEWAGIGLVINWVFTIFAWLTFMTWFLMKGMSLWRARSFVPQVISFIIDIIPGTDATFILSFTWTVAILVAVSGKQ